eukprot:3432265-Pleurochrysis_carterae.AAC.1
MRCQLRLYARGHARLGSSYCDNISIDGEQGQCIRCDNRSIDGEQGLCIRKARQRDERVRICESGERGGERGRRPGDGRLGGQKRRG